VPRGFNHIRRFVKKTIVEMTTGLPPFYSENVNLMYKKILHNQLVFPTGFSEKAQLLVRGVSGVLDCGEL
jgi:hypothetical protein